MDIKSLMKQKKLVILSLQNASKHLVIQLKTNILYTRRFALQFIPQVHIRVLHVLDFFPVFWANTLKMLTNQLSSKL